MVLFSDINKTRKAEKTKTTTKKPIHKKKSKKKLTYEDNEIKYTITIAMIIHGCVITTDLNQLNQNYNIDLYNATDNNIDVCEKTIWEFNDEHEHLLKHFRKNNPIPEKKNYFDKMPYDKFIGKTSNDLYAGVWLISVHDNNNQLVFPRNDSLDIRYNLFNLNLLNRLFLDFNRNTLSYTGINYEDIYNTEYNIPEYSEITDTLIREKHKKPPEKKNEEKRNFTDWNVSVNDVKTHIDKIRLSYLLDCLKSVFGDNVKFRAYDYTCTVPCNDTDDIQINLPLIKYGGKKTKNKTKRKTKKRKRQFNLYSI